MHLSMNNGNFLFLLNTSLDTIISDYISSLFLLSIDVTASKGHKIDNKRTIIDGYSMEDEVVYIAVLILQPLLSWSHLLLKPT